MHLSEHSWQSRCEALLYVLDQGWDTKKQPGTLGQTNKPATAAFPIGLRIKRAVQAVRKGDWQEGLQMLLMAEPASKDYDRNLQWAHRLRSEGSFEDSLQHFGSAARTADDEYQCCEAIFQLGHVAKICGRYALAVECFAFVAGCSNEDVYFAPAIKADLRGAIEGMTSTFNVECSTRCQTGNAITHDNLKSGRGNL